MIASTFTWGTVTGVSPLRVRLDGDLAALPFTPDSLIDPLALAVDDRVRCELANKRPVVLGVAGGVAPVTPRIHLVTNLAALDALSPARGDLAYMTTPGTGISALWWEAFAGSGTGSDWQPVTDVIASSAANLTSFISAVSALADTVFKIGGRAIVTAASGGRYERFFTSTAGAMTPTLFYGFGRTIRRRAAANLATSGSVATLTLGTSVQDPGDFTYSGGTLTCVTAGTYKITGVVDFAGSATGARSIGLQFSIAGTVYQQLGAVTSLALTMTIVTYITLAAGDTVALVAQQNSGGNLSTSAGLELERVA